MADMQRARAAVDSPDSPCTHAHGTPHTSVGGAAAEAEAAAAEAEAAAASPCPLCAGRHAGAPWPCTPSISATSASLGLAASRARSIAASSMPAHCACWRSSRTVQLAVVTVRAAADPRFSGGEAASCPDVSILNFNDKNRRDIGTSQSKWTAFQDGNARLTRPRRSCSRIWRASPGM
jgi:hypothetical protein